MSDARAPISVYNNANDIESYLPVVIDLAHISQSSPDNELFFFRSDRHFGSAEKGMAARLCFYKNQGILVPGDEIDLRTTVPPVDFQNRVTLVFQISFGDLFASFSQVVVVGHVGVD